MTVSYGDCRGNKSTFELRIPQFFYHLDFRPFRSDGLTAYCDTDQMGWIAQKWIARGVGHLSSARALIDLDWVTRAKHCHRRRWGEYRRGTLDRPGHQSLIRIGVLVEDR